MTYDYNYSIHFISIRILCPKSNEILFEVQRAVNYIEHEPDWDHLDDVISTFLEAQDIDTYIRLPNVSVHPQGGWVTHTFDMGCPRLVWTFPDPVSKEGVV